MKVYSNAMSNNCLKVLWAARLLEIDLEVQEMDFKKDLKTDSYLKLHPAGKIPTLEDDGFVLFESNAIMKYLARKASSPLYPEDPQRRALVDQWIDFSTMHVAQPLSKVAFNRAWAPLMGLPVNDASIEEGEKFLGQHLPIVEARLSNNDFIAGDQLTLADVALLGATYYAEPAKVDLSAYPKLIAWREKIMKRVGASPMKLG